MNRLLGEVDGSILRLSQIGDLNPSLRFDAEFFSRAALDALAEIRRTAHERLGDLCTRIQHPIEVKRDYEETGLLTVMAKNVRSNRVELSDVRFMPEDLRPTVDRNKLAYGDVLVTRTGANFGQVAPWKRHSEAFACADILIIRKPTLPSGYLSSFLECHKGKLLILRGGYGAGQPHIAPPYLANMLVPRFSLLETRVDTLVDHAVEQEAEAVAFLDRAECQLLSALGLSNWAPPEPLSYTARASEAVSSGRLDSRFFAPRIQALLDQLSVDGRTIGDVAKPRRQKFRPENCVNFNYIEISDIDVAGTAGSTQLACTDAPSRATWHVKPSDIITSTVRPVRRLSAQITSGQDGHVCSSGFVVIQPRTIASEVLLTYLRLPVICELLDLYASASMYPAITDAHIFGLPIPSISNQVAQQVVQNVQESKAAKAHAVQFLDAAKRAVEIAIEEGEPAAMAYLDTVERVL